MHIILQPYDIFWKYIQVGVTKGVTVGYVLGYTHIEKEQDQLR
jgi:hypothetical protein